MTDYSTWKVTDLKAELKRRGIPQTGLRLKKEIIEKLEEEDTKSQGGGVHEATTSAESEPDGQETSQPAEPEAPIATEKADDDGAQTQDTTADAPAAQSEPMVVDEKLNEHIAQAPPPKPDGSTGQPSQRSQAQEPQKEAEESQQGNRESDASVKEAEAEIATQPAEEKETRTKVGDEESNTEALSKPVEQAPGNTDEAEPKLAQGNAKQTEATDAQVAAPGGQTSGVNTGLSTPLPPEELIDDVRKRKRRSQSPAPHLEEAARKKAKAAEKSALPTPDESISASHDELQQPPVQSPTPEARSPRDETSAKKNTPQKQDVRFKGLFTSIGVEKTRPPQPPVDTEMEDIAVEPALHAATAAIYIDGLMRPLQPAALKNHLLSVASPPGKSPNPDLIVDFYLDPIKTHCFVTFVDVSTASRARNSLHGTVWPDEKNRKSLFVDFIPEQKVQEWIQMEEEARGERGRPPRWEVKYKRGDVVEAILEQIDFENAGTHGSRGPAPNEFAHPPPRGPRAETQPMDRRPDGPSETGTSSHPAQGFESLDQLFESTTTKPKLFYLPVPRAVADRRLDRFDDLLRKGSFPRRGGDETRKYSFVEDDLFVDLGPEFSGRGRGAGRGRGRGGAIVDSRRDRRDWD
ncbi:hypothetical protein BDW72DRAFT_183503 [Aspergillus terricola var. indicus]